MSLNFLKARNKLDRAVNEGYITDKSASTRESFVYKDITFDLSLDTVYATNRHEIKETYKQLRTLTDLQCVINSVKNILHTRRGQKILNPLFGLDLSSLLFQPVNIYTGQTIAQLIAEEVTKQERRININNVHCVGYPDLNQYTVEITCTIPEINNIQIALNGIITANGVKIDKIDNESIG